ncbi:hypothetical protein FJZ26_03545 [Candidatus Parvarchaeota archaeon]|nr:hypothetical protein [Candidatus Parvarchaeota archaeon]
MRCENCLYKNNEVHVNFYSRIVVLRQSVKPYKTAKVLEIGTESGGSVLFVETDSGRLWLDGKAALDFLGISALPCGVSMETVIGLKSPYLKGRTLKYDQNPSSSPKTNSKSISPVKAVFLGFEK